MKDMPIACSLSPETVATRRAGLLPGLSRRAAAVEDLPDGLRFRFRLSADILAAIASVIDAESQCCRFLQFDLRVEQDGGPITLSLTGPPGTREFVAQLLAD